MKRFILTGVLTLSPLLAFAHDVAFAHQHHEHIVRGAPGPIAGAGLPLVLGVLGGMWLWRRWHHRL